MKYSKLNIYKEIRVMSLPTNTKMEIAEIQVIQDEFKREKFIRLFIKNKGSYERIHDVLQVTDNILFQADGVRSSSVENFVDIVISDLNVIADNGEIVQWAEYDSGIKAFYNLIIGKPEQNLILKTYTDDIAIKFGEFRNTVEDTMKSWGYIN